ncbi:hypothetical protein OLMES_1309 [Oleiphilus messinensis]|uniref:Uncharacterized protein n=1 Tax=Oleiphilus messinensis TaxID=141451 RepID=A0A1Y0I4F7_9GAMM|nr:hypothetical protein [Oleiphilus messinensis]ARU55388.1 hypothetical protein OLMES_1309 [Oleiphilus messinensis]
MANTSDTPTEFARLHPILNEMTRTFTDLYLHRKDEETRLKLLALEEILEARLGDLREARARAGDDVY